MKFRRTFAAITAAAMAVSSMAVFASAEDAAAVTDEQYFELIKTVKSVSAKLTVNELAPDTADGFAAFFMQNNGGDWAWFASADEAESVKITGAGEYEVKWADVQSVIGKTAGSVTLSYLKAPAEEWETWPAFGIQVGSDGITAAGDTGKVDAKVTGVVITFTDDTTMELPEFAVAGDLLGKEEEWGLSGNNVMFNMKDLIMAAMAETPEDDTTGDDTTNEDNTVGDTEAPGESTEVPEEPAAPTDVALDNAGTITMDGGWRVNLVHPWAGEENKEAFNIVDATKFANSNTISVKFKATNVTAPFTAWLAFATNDDTGLAYWGADNAANSGVTQTPITIDKDGYYVLTLTTDKLITVGENFFLALQTDNKDEESELAIELVAVKAGEALEVTEDDVIEVPGESGTNPPTGVTLVVVPAALAAAALATSGIVLKKRSK